MTTERKKRVGRPSAIQIAAEPKRKGRAQVWVVPARVIDALEAYDEGRATAHYERRATPAQLANAWGSDWKSRVAPSRTKRLSVSERAEFKRMRDALRTSLADVARLTRRYSAFNKSVSGDRGDRIEFDPRRVMKPKHLRDIAPPEVIGPVVSTLVRLYPREYAGTLLLAVTDGYGHHDSNAKAVMLIDPTQRLGL